MRNVVFPVAYDDLGRRIVKNYGNGAQQSYSYDGASRLNGLNSLLANNAGNVLSFTLSPSGQLATRTSSNDAYAWAGAYNVMRPYTTNGLNQYTVSGALSLTYDGRGNLTGDGSTTYAYSSENALRSASGATNATMYYDPANRMIEYDTSVSTRFLYDGPDMIAEINNPSGAVSRRFVHGPNNDEPLIWYEGADTGTRRWLLADERGSVVAVSNSAGMAVTINSYDAFGYPNAGSSGRFQFTGQTWLAELGLYNFKARIYSPTLGRFLQFDPIGYGDGLNANSYAHADPINGRDPSGLDTGSLIPGQDSIGGELSIAYGPAHDGRTDGLYSGQKTVIDNGYGQSATHYLFYDANVVPYLGFGTSPGVSGFGNSPGGNFQQIAQRYNGLSFCGGAAVGNKNFFNPSGRIVSGKTGNFDTAVRDIDRISAVNGKVPLGSVIVNVYSTALMTQSLIPFSVGGGWVVSKNYWSGDTSISNAGLTLRYNPEAGKINIDIPSGTQLPGGGQLSDNETCHYH